MEALRNWTEDFSHENGNYTNCCSSCGNEFLGHKRRIFCKVCTDALIEENSWSTDFSNLPNYEEVEIKIKNKFGELITKSTAHGNGFTTNLMNREEWESDIVNAGGIVAWRKIEKQ